MSSGFFPDYIFFDILKKQISDKLFNLTKIKYKSSVWWANYYDIGHHAEIHSHQPEDISSIVFIKTDESNPLYFDFEPGVLNVEEEDGLVLLFDSKIKHKVRPCINERISLAIEFVKDI